MKNIVQEGSIEIAARAYYSKLLVMINKVKACDRNEALGFYQAIEMVGQLILAQIDSKHKILFIGNGASASISSHMATDFWKNGGMRAISFNDSSLLTCVSNDYSYSQVFAKPIEMFADQGDLLFAISSSGRSENIVRGVTAAKEKGCHVVTLSGFAENNPLFSLGEYNFHVPIHDYGPVEIIHHSICHCILDSILKAKNG